MITVRTLLDTDVLTPPHWPIPIHRPCPETTLVAIDDASIIRGLCWAVYGGPVAMVVLWVSAEPCAAWKLHQELFGMSQAMGCASIVGHIQCDTRFLDVLSRRGWFVNTAWKSVAVSRPVNGKISTEIIREVLKNIAPIIDGNRRRDWGSERSAA